MRKSEINRTGRNVFLPGALFLFLTFLFLSNQNAFSLPLGNVTVTPTNSEVVNTTIYTVNFDVSGTGVINADSKILVAFPAGFDISGIVFVSSTTMTGTFSIGISGQTVTFSRPGGVNFIFSWDPADLTFANVVNPTTSGTAYTVSVETTTNADVRIDGPTASANFTITPGPADYFDVVTQNGGVEGADTAFTLTVSAYDEYGNAASGYVGAHTIDFTSTATVSPGGGSGLTVPTVPVQEVGVVFDGSGVG
ncbi:MAG TPA: hypothetical protein ENI15_00975, partial [Spirochaetes bacterium]|nr:hypothetical protein [Spirochaetota bacterium]